VSFQINERENGAVTILDVSGRITLGDATASLREKIRELTQDGRNQILLNMSGVSYIDSSGLGELTAGYTTVSQVGGQLKLVSLPEKFEGLMQVTKLTTVFDIFEEEAYAVLSFG
jgi:anti-sigma B factor antagonist